MEKSTKLFIVQVLGAIAICLSLTSLILVYLWMDDYLGTDQHMDPHKYTSQTMAHCLICSYRRTLCTALFIAARHSGVRDIGLKSVIIPRCSESVKEGYSVCDCNSICPSIFDQSRA